MIIYCVKQCLLCLLTASIMGGLLLPAAAQAEEPAALAGQHEWLFYRYEWTSNADLAASNISIDLIKSFSKVLQDNGITLIVSMVPIKARVYQAQLPDQNRLTPYMAGNYQRMAQALSANGVKVIDLDSSFIQEAKKHTDKPLFFRLDSHWTPAGALFAAETIASGMEADPALKSLLRSIPAEKYSLRWSEQAVKTTSRDLVSQLPKTSVNYAPESVYDFEVSKAGANNNLLGEVATPQISLVGSSYSKAWTRFPEAIKYQLQKDVLSIAIAADQGSWVGMETYLRDEAFQNKPPKILIWEMPERDMRAPPAYLYRETRYRSDNLEWLQRVSALVQMQCQPALASARLVAEKMAVHDGNHASMAKTGNADYLSIQFSQAVSAQEFLQASIQGKGLRYLNLEAWKGTEVVRKWSSSMNGDGAPHLLKLALPNSGKTYTSLKIWPGEVEDFAINELRLCRQPPLSLK